MEHWLSQIVSWLLVASAKNWAKASSRLTSGKTLSAESNELTEVGRLGALGILDSEYCPLCCLGLPGNCESTIPILSLDEEAEDLEEPNRVYQATYQTSVRAVTTVHVCSSVRTLSVSVTTWPMEFSLCFELLYLSEVRALARGAGIVVKGEIQPTY